MKKKLLALLCITASTAFCGDNDSFGRTFYSIHPHYQSGSPEHDTLFHDEVIHHKDGIGGAFEFVTFGGRSTNSEDLGKYFLPNGRNCIFVAQDNAPNAKERDVDAYHLNIRQTSQDDATFSSLVTFNPRHSFAGFGLRYHHEVYDWNSNAVWLDISLPIMQVTNEICIDEKILSRATPDTLADGAVPNASSAFQQDAWCAGRIECGKMSRWGVADIEVRAGLYNDPAACCKKMLYVGIVIPTGNKPVGRYVFEPIVGNNRHFGLLAGSSLSAELWSSNEHVIYAGFYAHTRYLVGNRQCRSFDVLSKPWSRYMTVYTSRANADADITSPGINSFTQDVKVQPRFVHTINTNFHYHYRGIHADVGYGLFCRYAERICADCFKGTVALANRAGADSPDGDTTFGGTISFGASSEGNCSIDDGDYAQLNACDITLASASHPNVVSHTVYGSVGKSWERESTSPFVGGGGSYEFSSSNAGLDHWTLWIKMGFSF